MFSAFRLIKISTVDAAMRSIIPLQLQFTGFLHLMILLAALPVNCQFRSSFLDLIKTLILYSFESNHTIMVIARPAESFLCHLRFQFIFYIWRPILIDDFVYVIYKGWPNYCVVSFFSHILFQIYKLTIYAQNTSHYKVLGVGHIFELSPTCHSATNPHKKNRKTFSPKLFSIEITRLFWYETNMYDYKTLGVANTLELNPTCYKATKVPQRKKKERVGYMKDS